MPTFPPSRYEVLYRTISARCPQRILEIGTNDGVNALHMIRAARSCAHVVEYYGFDLFEHQGGADLVREFAIPVPSLAQVTAYLVGHGLRQPHLVAGDSVVTLPAHVSGLPTMDVIFIDGGHSYETARSDWLALETLIRPGTVVFFDDYPNWGIRSVVDEISRDAWTVDVLPTTDRFRSGPGAAELACQVVRVARR